MVSAGVAAVAGPVVVPLAAADPVDGADDASTPLALPADGTYESCTAYFGLGKGDSDLVSYDLETVGPVNPVPVIGTDLIPLLTVQGLDGDGGAVTAQCIPEQGWTDEDSFDDWLDFGNVGFTYPGTGYYLIPATWGLETTTPQGAFTPTSTSIEFLHELTGVTVSWSPTEPNAVENGFMVYSGGPLPATDPTVQAAVAAITAVDGDTAAGALAQQILTAGACDDADPAIPGLAAALTTLLGDEGVPETCGNVSFATGYYYRVLLLDRMVDESLVLVTVTAPTGPTTEPPAAAAATETPPTFTG